MIVIVVVVMMAMAMMIMMRWFPDIPLLSPPLHIFLHYYRISSSLRLRNVNILQKKSEKIISRSISLLEVGLLWFSLLLFVAIIKDNYDLHHRHYLYLKHHS